MRITMVVKIFILLGGLFLSVVNCEERWLDEMKASKWLKKYGYLSSDYSTVDESLQVDALVRFQYLANLTVTGKLDKATLQKMDEERCGLGDPHIHIPNSVFEHLPSPVKIYIKKETLSRVRRYNHQGTVWKKSLLTWRLMKNTQWSRLTEQQVRQTFRTACETWSHYTNIEFQEIRAGEPDIEVLFARRRHNDPFPFDGPGGTLAHAFYPLQNTGLAGDVHMDDDEEFTIHSPEGINLAWVVTHELGHSLGLDHSPVEDAVMYPYYKGYKPGGVKLNYDDILGIQTLYEQNVEEVISD